MQEVSAYGVAGAVAEEVLSSIRTVVAFGGEKKEEDRYNKLLKFACDNNIKRSLYNGICIGAMWMSIYACYALGFWYGVQKILANKQNYDVKAVITVFTSIASGTWYLTGILPYLETFAMAQGAAAKIFEIIASEPVINASKCNGKTYEKFIGKITFRNVSFSYPSRPSVKVLFDNYNLSGLDLTWVRSHIGVVSQEPVLFDATIAENIKLSCQNATQEDIEKAAKKANAHNFIQTFPKKYETVVGQRGTQLSGGQKQRIAIGRALIRKPSILLLDEATSALDASSEAIVQKVLDAASIKCTTVIVSHRLSTIKRADKIVVMSEGRVQEEGTHQNLIRKKGLYYDLVTAQLLQEDDNKKMSVPERLETSKSTMEKNYEEKQSPVLLESFQESNELSSFSIWRVVIGYNLSECWAIGLGCLCSLINGAGVSVYSIVFGKFIQVLVVDDKDYILNQTAMFVYIIVGIAVILGFATLFQTYFFGLAGEKLTMLLRSKMFQFYLSQDMSYFDDKANAVGTLCAKLSHEAASVQGATGQRIGTILTALSTVICALVSSFYFEWKVTLSSFCLAPFIIIVCYWEPKLSEEDDGAHHKELEQSTKIAVEAINGIQTVAALGCENVFYDNYMKGIASYQQKSKRNSHFHGIIHGLSRGLMYFGYAVVFYYGSFLIINSHIEYYRVLIASKCIVSCFCCIANALMFTSNFQKGATAAKQILQVLDNVSLVRHGSGDANQKWVHPTVEYKNIQFFYPSRPKALVLQKFDIKVLQGKMVALVGPSGCGKSTVLQLFLRFYDPTSGTISIDDVPIHTMHLSALRSQLGVVSQEPVLFNLTIADNISYGDNSRLVSKTEIIESARKANIHNFIVSLPLGYDTKLGEKGTQLSGGQKQRIAIARALIRNPKILLLDEATSALDAENEKIVQEALDNASKDRTCITIAHRLNTIQKADLICFIKQGRIIEAGFLGFFGAYLATVLFSLAALNQIFIIQKLFFTKILNQDISWYDLNQTGDFASLVADDLKKVQDGIGEKVPIVISYLAVFITCILQALIARWDLAVICMVLLPISLGALSLLFVVTSKYTMQEARVFGAAGAVAEEALSSIRTVVAFGGEKLEETRYNNLIKTACDNNIKRSLYNGVCVGAICLSVYTSYALGFWYGVENILANAQNYNVRVIITVLSSISIGTGFLVDALPYLETFAMAQGSAHRIFEIIASEPVINASKNDGKTYTPIKGKITFENVTFKYPSRPDVKVLQNFNLTVNSGETVALVGCSGCGKSTCIQLIQRFYDPELGSILVDDHNLTGLDVNWLRSHIGVVSQEPVLFDATITENIKLGCDSATQDEIEEAAKKANAHSFIQAFPKQYETLVGQRGTQLSGGQKQRIAIARALVRKPSILLLDEATSSLDRGSETNVQTALDAVDTKCTTIIVAHRLSTIKRADKIVVMSEGRIQEEGTHQNLIQRKGAYFDLLTGQVLKEDVEKEMSVLPQLASSELSDKGENYQDLVLPKKHQTNKTINYSLTWQIIKSNLPEWWVVVFGCICSLINGAGISVFAFIFGKMMGILVADDEDYIRKQTAYYVSLFLALAVTLGLATLFQTYTFGLAGEKLAMRLRSKMFQSFLSQDMSFYDDKKNSVGTLCATLSYEAASVQGALGLRISAILTTFSIILFGMSSSFYFEWRVTLISLCFAPFIIASDYGAFKVNQDDDKAHYKTLQESTKIAVEAINGITTITSLGCQNKFYDHYVQTLALYRQTCKRKSYFYGLMYGLSRGVMFFCFAILLYYGSTLIVNQRVEYYRVLIVSETVIPCFWSISQALAFAPNLQNGVIGINRITQLLNNAPQICHGSNNVNQELKRSNVEYQNVIFVYPSRPRTLVLDGFDMEVLEGKTVALVGPSGCGKSTVVQLLFRFYDLRGGTISIDDTAINGMHLSALRSQISVVSQEPVLFSLTIADNISYGDNKRVVSRNEIIEAARKANIHDFIASLPLGYDTKLGEKGTQLSGGQKQRIAIARSLIRNPKILLLDEATSALDAESNCILGFLSFAGLYIATLLFNLTALNQIYKIQKLFFTKILNQDISWYDLNQTGDFASRVAEDLKKIQDGIGEKVPIVIGYFVVFITCIFQALIAGWELALICMALLPISLSALGLLFFVTSKYAMQEGDVFGAAGAVAEEVFSSIRTVVAFGGEKLEETRYTNLIKTACDNNTKRAFYNGVCIGVICLSMYTCYALGFWYGVEKILANAQNYNITVMITVLYSIAIGTSYLVIALPYLETFAMAQGSALRIFEIIASEPVINASKNDGKIYTPVKGKITFENVTFKYPSRPDVKVLQNFNLTVNSGETVALVGSSGCGKSTCIQLIQRFYDPELGSILVDNHNLTGLDVNWLRSHIGVVSQEPVLFDATVAENIKLGCDSATQDEIEEAAKRANAHGFIQAFPKQYETLVGQRGTQLSGGQKQRIAIARALIRKPSILLLDEATSSLDRGSEANVQTALDAVNTKCTTIIVAHRLSTIKRADKIVVMSEGRIQEEGTHQNLIQRKGAYFDLLTGQVLKEDVEKEMSVLPQLASSELSDKAENYQDLVLPKEHQANKTFNFSLTCQIIKSNLPEWWIVVLGCICSLINGAGIPVHAIIFGEMMGILVADDKDCIRNQTAFYVSLFLGLAVVLGFANLFQTYTFGLAGEKLTMRLRSKMFQSFLSQDMSFFDDQENSVGTLCVRLSHEAASVQGATGQRISAILTTLSTIWFGLGISFYFEWRVTLISLCFAPFIIALDYGAIKINQDDEKAHYKTLQQSTKIAVEAINGITTITSLGCQKKFYDHYVQELALYQQTCKRKSYFNGLIHGLSRGMMFFCVAILYYYGSTLIINQRIEYYCVLVVSKSVIPCFWSISQALAFSPDFQKGVIAVNRITQLLQNAPQIRHGSNNVNQKLKHSNLKYKNVKFVYPSRPRTLVLDDFDIEVMEGKTVALVGPSGCGKSTIVQLLFRFYDLRGGIISIDDTAINGMHLSALRSHLSVVSQEPVLFSLTIADNISYGDNKRVVSRNEIIEAARKANIHDFIASLPLGYDTKLGEKGTQLSGGQKQRIAIARSLIRNPKILLLNEATSALDAESEKAVQKALDNASNGRTCITIAHRLNTIQNADVICFIKQGRIVEMGSHSELIGLKRLYYNYCFVSFGGLYLATVLFSLAALNQIYKIQKLFFTKILYQDISWYDLNQTGDFASRVADDLRKIQDGIGEKVPIVIGYFVVFITCILQALIARWELALICMVLLPISLSALSLLFLVTSKYTMQEVDVFGAAGAVAEEVLSSIRTVVAFGGEKLEETRYNNLIKIGCDNNIKRSFYNGVCIGALCLSMYTCYALGFWYSVEKILANAQNYNVRVMITVLSSIAMGTAYLVDALPYLETFAMAQGSALRIFEIIASDPVINALKNDGKTYTPVKGKITFKNVTFKYPSRPDVKVLQNFNLTVNSGETVALVGSSGCGKSTCIQLIQRFYDPELGSILVDNHNLTGLDVNWLRSHIGVVSQEPVLFDATVAENIKLGCDSATQDEIEEAAKKANAHGFIQAFPKQYETLVGQRGTQLSGGQKQRIAIARALVRKPSILLLDEATSSLDRGSEANVQTALDAVNTKCATIIVAHRLSTIKRADKIVVMSEGRIQEEGTHQNLILKKGAYFDLLTGQILKKDVDKEMSVLPRLASLEVHEKRENYQALVLPEEHQINKTFNLSLTWQIIKSNLPEWWVVVFGCICSLINGAGIPVYAIIFGKMIGILVAEDKDFIRNQTAFYVILFLALAVALGLATLFQTYTFGLTGEKLTMRLRSKMFQSFLSQDMTFFDDQNNSVGTLCSRLSYEAASVQGVSVSETVMSCFWSISQALGFSQNFQKGVIAINRITQLLKNAPQIHHGSNNVNQKLKHSNVEYRNVKFFYPSRPRTLVLDDFDMEVLEGKTVAIVGPSGCGKSTIVQLLFRFYDLRGGTISIDDTAVNDMHLSALRSHLSVVSQEPVLFSLSIADNISYGDNKRVVSRNEIIEAARKANIHDFIASLPLVC
ncbi:hypothetical protein RN001_015241 [Aquatica leii]|uniref:ABC-type xenobiotic transporter n=1 Tax=Aquatica leii TaxID=1421715 RepID=A0AAN7SBZ0_9COLE|nr:hypothetical protein RN001_015241 [Aquatica leii]